MDQPLGECTERTNTRWEEPITTINKFPNSNISCIFHTLCPAFTVEILFDCHCKNKTKTSINNQIQAREMKRFCSHLSHLEVRFQSWVEFIPLCMVSRVPIQNFSFCNNRSSNSPALKSEVLFNPSKITKTKLPEGSSLSGQSCMKCLTMLQVSCLFLI